MDGKNLKIVQLRINKEIGNEDTRKHNWRDNITDNFNKCYKPEL